VSDVQDGWPEHNEDSSTPASLRDQTSRVRLAQNGATAGTPLARLGVGEVDRWLTRMRRAGLALRLAAVAGARRIPTGSGGGSGRPGRRPGSTSTGASTTCDIFRQPWSLSWATTSVPSPIDWAIRIR
jgi:hypothetical protein